MDKRQDAELMQKLAEATNRKLCEIDFDPCGNDREVVSLFLSLRGIPETMQFPLQHQGSKHPLIALTFRLRHIDEQVGKRSLPPGHWSPVQFHEVDDAYLLWLLHQHVTGPRRLRSEHEASHDLLAPVLFKEALDRVMQHAQESVWGSEGSWMSRFETGLLEAAKEQSTEAHLVRNLSYCASGPNVGLVGDARYRETGRRRIGTDEFSVLDVTFEVGLSAYEGAVMVYTRLVPGQKAHGPGLVRQLVHLLRLDWQCEPHLIQFDRPGEQFLTDLPYGPCRRDLLLIHATIASLFACLRCERGKRLVSSMEAIPTTVREYMLRKLKQDYPEQRGVYVKFLAELNAREADRLLIEIKGDKPVTGRVNTGEMLIVEFRAKRSQLRRKMCILLTREGCELLV